MAGLKDLPIGLLGTGFGILAKDLDPAFALPSTAIGQGQITPDNMGFLAWNATGSTITAGSLVNVGTTAGWNAAHGLPQVALAAASSRFGSATHVALANIANGAAGPVGRHFSLTGVNTASPIAVGDPVYLSSGSPGSYLIPNPNTNMPAPVSYIQLVGRVAVAAASGTIDFDLETGSLPFEDALRPQVTIPTVPVTGATTTSQLLIMPRAGVIIGMRLIFVSALAVGANGGAGAGYVDLTVTNKAAGAGSTVLTATPAANVNSTRSTGGGTTAIVAATPFVLTGSAGPFTVNANDALQLDILSSSQTLANTLAGGIFEVVLQVT